MRTRTCTSWLRVLLVAALVLVALPRPAHAQTDMIDPSTIQFVGPGAQVGTFPITTGITLVSVDGPGTNLDFSKKDGPGRWPDQLTPGWTGTLQYSVGFVLKVNGQWYASAPIENWYGRTNGTGPIQDQTITCASGTGQIHCNLFYDSRWGALAQAHPQPGETIGIFVASGDARNNYFVTRERSNIVTFPLPASGQTAQFSFPAGSPAPTPGPTPTPAPTPTPTPTPAPDLSSILQRLSTLEARAQLFDGMLEQLQTRVQVLEARPVYMTCSAQVNLGFARFPVVGCQLR